MGMSEFLRREATYVRPEKHPCHTGKTGEPVPQRCDDPSLPKARRWFQKGRDILHIVGVRLQPMQRSGMLRKEKIIYDATAPAQ
jgi:hypothetical protein